MSDKPIQYIAGVAISNSRDFTPQAWLDEIDRQAKADREYRFRLHILNALAYFGFFLGMFLFLKSL